MRPVVYRMVAVLLLWQIAGCDRLSVKQSLSDTGVELVNQNGEEVHFPEDFRGEVVLIGYIYTYCPDICPVITQKMHRIQQSLDPDMEEVHFIGITMDPDRDTPEILADYASRIGLDAERWTLLTGDRSAVSKLMDELDVIVRRTPTRFTEAGDPIYFLDHSDKVSLFDSEANLRHDYMGSELSGEQVVSDIRELLRRQANSD